MTAVVESEPDLCPTPASHAWLYGQSETRWWKRARGEHERPKGDRCPYCGKRLPDGGSDG